MGNVQGKHKTVGIEMSQEEWEAAGSHDLTVEGAAARDLIHVNSDGTMSNTNTPSVQKIKVGGAAGVPANEIDLASGTMECAVGTLLRSRGLIAGAVGEHGKGMTEFIHCLLDEQSGSAIADKTGHFAGTLNGAFANTTSVPSGLTSALTFEGLASNYVDLGKADYSTWTELSISCWFKVASDSPDTSQWIVSNAYNTGTGWNLIYVGGSTNKLGFYVNSQWASGLSIASGFSKDTWFHAVGTFSRYSGKIKLFVNGGSVVYSEVAVSGTASLNESSVKNTLIGTRPTSGGGAFKGSIADVRIFSRELRRSEIEALYNSGYGRKDSLNVMSGYADKRWSEVRSYTATPTATNAFASTDGRLVAGVPIRYYTNGALYYGLVQARVGTAVYILGAPLSTSYPIQYLEVGPPDAVVVERFALSGSYASGKSAGAVLESRPWRRGPAVCVGLSARHATNDTGATQPAVNLKLGGSATGVSTANSGNGPTLSSAAWTPDQATSGTGLVAVSPTYYGVTLAQAVDLVLTVTGTNKDATGLVVDGIFILK